MQGRVTKVSFHYVICKRFKKGRPIKVAHEETRLVPQVKLAEELQNTFLEDLIQHDPNRKQLGFWTSSRMNDASARNVMLYKHSKSGLCDSETLNVLLDVDELEITEVFPPLHLKLMTHTHKMDIRPVKI